MRFCLIILAALVWAAPANAHLMSKPKNDSLAAREKSQRVNLAHARYVCESGAKMHRRWSCKAVGWLSRELHETREARTPPAPRVSYGTAICGSSCIQCESGGNPSAWNAAGYWGLYQFDRGTWVAHGGSPSEYGRAPAWRQHQVAQNINYDAWPNC